ncbi:Uncharacterised protein [Mycobacteroides abscessus]|nr:Uncharacterised protein [Mycobacteroides abscessus]
MARHRRIRTYLDTQTSTLRQSALGPAYSGPDNPRAEPVLRSSFTAIHQWIYLPNSGTLIVRNAIAEYIVSLGNLLFRLP